MWVAMGRRSAWSHGSAWVSMGQPSQASRWRSPNSSVQLAFCQVTRRWDDLASRGDIDGDSICLLFCRFLWVHDCILSVVQCHSYISNYFDAILFLPGHWCGTLHEGVRSCHSGGNVSRKDFNQCEFEPFGSFWQITRFTTDGQSESFSHFSLFTFADRVWNGVASPGTRVLISVVTMGLTANQNALRPRTLKNKRRTIEIQLQLKWPYDIITIYYNMITMIRHD